MRLLFIVALVASVTFSGCKKGENDPFFSLKTRKGRLAGDWKVSFAEYTINDTSWTYDGTTLKETFEGNLVSEIKITYDYSFNKSGDYSINREEDYPANYFSPNTPPLTYTYFEQGTWNFTGGAGGTKTKSQLLLQTERIERRVEGLDEVDAQVHENPILGKIMDLDMLKNKEMRWKYDYTGSTPSAKIIEFGTWEFEKQ
ncbi:MAG: hypothetical protein ACPGEG_04505 [Salibacteraceae bacterium]